MEYELALVMPVYNEESCIAGVIRAWQGVLEQLGLRYRLIVLDDGSTDGTAAVLAELGADPRLEVIAKPNSGHGPTILQGYHRAVKLADWVFQCDSDGEIAAEHFPRLWQLREDHDAVFGVRQGRIQPWGRRLLSFGARLVVRLLFAAGVADVNVPYRLMRAEPLASLVAQLPPDTFAPNVLIAGAFARRGARIANVPVPFEPRRTGMVSLAGMGKILRVGWRCLWQTWRCRKIRIGTATAKGG